ncbi:MAG TPA: ATP-binding protein [Acidimicrobiales bacterium]|nr:ATP-binding protein [Acidimicrobiales bacterium]
MFGVTLCVEEAGMRAQHDFPGEPAAVSSARAFVAATLAAWDLDDLAEVAVLLTSEVVTNAVRYAPGTVSVAIDDEREVRFEVGDESPVPPRLRAAGPGDEGGRGLRLLGSLAHRWGWRPRSSGKVVWFTLLRP